MNAFLEIAKQAYEATTSAVASNPGLATFATIFSIVSAIWTNHRNRQATIFGHSLQAITHLDERWESPQMRRDRRLAALYLLSPSPDAKCGMGNVTSHDCEHLDAVLNFLETVGWFVQSGAIHRRTAFHLFSSKALLYAEGARAFIDECRELDATTFSELMKFYAICRVEKVRVDSIGWFIWERTSSVSLTWKNSAIRGTSTWESIKNCAFAAGRMCYAMVRGTLHPNQEISADLSRGHLHLRLLDEAALRQAEDDYGGPRRLLVELL